MLLAAEAERHAGHLAEATATADLAIDIAMTHHLALHEAHGHLARATLLLQRSLAATDEDARLRTDGRAALRRAQRTYARWQSAWGTVRCLMLAKSYGLRIDDARLRDLTRQRFPAEAAELGLLARDTVPATPLVFPGG